MQGNHALNSALERLRERGGAPLALLLLDAFEPAAPLLAQTLLVAQPVANLWKAGDACRQLADLLDAPDGPDRLRRLLSADQAAD